MENNEKKPTFEPVSAEEAKKIRAFREKVDMLSGTVDCGSGFRDPYVACYGKAEGEGCCMRPNGQDVFGVCAPTSGTTAFQLKCISDPTQLPDGPGLPDWP